MWIHRLMVRYKVLRWQKTPKRLTDAQNFEPIAKHSFNF